MTAWTHVTVSVADLDEALDLWSGHFGLEIVARRDGDDADLARYWSLAPQEIHRQALLATPQASTGMIHLVEFDQPDSAVRDGAEVFDLCPKNLDIYVRDMPVRIDELKQAGMTFRNETFSEVTAPDGTRFREIHLPAHDAINIVLLEVLGKEMAFTPQGYAGVGPVITIVDDALSERAFYANVMGLDVLNDNILDGPEIEAMIGLPKGAALDVSIWGGEGESLGQVEVIDYRGIEGKDLFPLATPKHRGILQITYKTRDLQGFTESLDAAGHHWTEVGRFDLMPGAGRYIRLQSPAGLVIDVFQPGSD